jgi:hypothetical protein
VYQSRPNGSASEIRSTPCRSFELKKRRQCSVRKHNHREVDHQGFARVTGAGPKSIPSKRCECECSTCHSKTRWCKCFA